MVFVNANGKTSAKVEISLGTKNSPVSITTTENNTEINVEQAKLAPNPIEAIKIGDTLYTPSGQIITIPDSVFVSQLAIPNTIFTTYELALAAASTATASNDDSSEYHFGQILKVINSTDSTQAKLYVIASYLDSGTAKGTLISANQILDIDENQFLTSEGKLNLLGFDTAENGAYLAKTNGKVGWVKPAATTVEGYEAIVSELNETVNGSNGLVNKTQDLQSAQAALNQNVLDLTSIVNSKVSTADLADYLTQSSAAAIYATKEQLSTKLTKSDLAPYLTKEVADDTYLSKESVIGDISKLENIESGAQVNKIESISINGAALPITNKNANIPIASDTTAGAIKLSEDFKTNKNSQIEINKVNVNKLSQEDDDVLILISQ